MQTLNAESSEAATGGVLWKKVFLKISQISQESKGKNRLQHRCFPAKFAKLLRIPIL